jgi:hypothetical protein
MEGSGRGSYCPGIFLGWQGKTTKSLVEGSRSLGQGLNP